MATLFWSAPRCGLRIAGVSATGSPKLSLEPDTTSNRIMAAATPLHWFGAWGIIGYPTKTFDMPEESIHKEFLEESIGGAMTLLLELLPVF